MSISSAPANRVQENLDGRPWPDRMNSMFGFCEAAVGKGRALILLDDAILLPKRPLNDADVPAGASHERIAKRFAELPRMAAAKGGLAVILAQSPERAAAVAAEEGFVSAALAAEGGQAPRWQQTDPGRFSQLRWPHATRLTWPGVDEGEPFGPLFPVSRARPNEPPPRLYNVLRSVPAAVLQQAVDPVHLRRELDKRVIGQEIVTRSIAKKIHERMGQEGRPGPVFTVLLAGATGSGKTEMAKALATTLFGSDKALFRVDCGGVLGEAGLQTLIGSPKGYSGSDSPGALTGHLRTTPRSVLLFDEIEKAYDRQLGPQSPLFKMLLSLLDEGRVTEQSTGETMDAKETVIFLTSNAAQRELATVLKEHGNDEAALIDETKTALGGYFSPEFLARIDLVTTTSPLNEEARRQIVALLAGNVARLYGIDIASVSPAFADAAIAHWARVENYGIREIRRWI
ncbi:AAA family ATPase, partial [Azospirillum sp. B506]|uniref:AAA family ATPase n=1 Tax=Azospirillum sp. B506 TaxID=137721 RepID=UPI0005B2C8CC